VHAADGIENLLIYLAAAMVLVLLCRALGVSTVLGYLATGIVIGPSLFGLVQKTPRVEAAGEVGVLFLLFTIGLELSTDRLRGLRVDAFGLGTAQVLLTGAILAAVVFAVSGLAPAAIAVGFSLALSSTAIVLQLLKDSGDLSRRTGRAALAVLLLQDLAVVPLLVLIPLLAGDGRGLLPALGLAALKTVIAGVVIVVLGRLVLRRLYHAVSALREPQMGLALTLLIALGAGFATERLGLSATLGAFLAGVLIAETEFRHQVEADVEPFRGLLLGIFFMSVGLSIDISALAGHATSIVALLAAIVLVKAGVLYGLALAFGLSRGQATYLSLLLAHGGEFAFVALGLSIGLGLIPPAGGAGLLAAVALSMFIAPALAALGRRLLGRMAHRAQPGSDAMASEAAEYEDHVVLAGCGRVGSTVLRVLAEHGVAAIAIDADPVRVGQLRSLGLPAFVGDAARPLLLESAGADRARAAVVTFDDPPAAESVCAALRQAHPRLEIVARASDRLHGERLLIAGASVAVAENLEASLELAGRVLEAFDFSPAEIERRLDELRADDYARLDEWRRRSGDR
jgi:CPA2 family monovalent cation:H+ antiporter-2